MKLSYRGNEYEKDNSILEMRESEISGKYRGHCWKYKSLNHLLPNHPKLNLQYRGIPYGVVSEEKEPIQYITPFQFTQKTDPVISHQNTEKIHLENLRLNLIRRLNSAKINGNSDLIEMLEKEFQQLEIK